MLLKLTSNVGASSLEGVGSIKLESGKIHIEAFLGCRASITRDRKVVVLITDTQDARKVLGVPKVGDVYTIERGFEKLTVNVEEDRHLETRNIFIKPKPFNELTDQNKKTTFTAGIVLLLLLIVSVVFGINQKKSRDFNEKSTIKLTQAISNYETALGEVDKKTARELFVESKKIATLLKDDGFKDSRLDELLKNIIEKEAEVIGEVKPEVKEFLDLTLQTSGFDGKNMVSSGEDIFIIDNEKKIVLKVNLKTKNAKLVANNDAVGETISIGSYDDRLFLNKDDGIYEVNTIAKKVIERDWNDSKLIYFYAGNSYLLDKDVNQIFRFAGSNNSFSKKSDWLAPGIEVDFSKVIDMVIDGSIWTLSETGKVTKFTNGNPQSISLNGMIENLENPTAIYTNEDNKNVYILEKDKERIIVIDKTGEFKMQYIGEEIKNAADLVVNEEEGKAVLLEGSKLMYLEIK